MIYEQKCIKRIPSIMPNGKDAINNYIYKIL